MENPSASIAAVQRTRQVLSGVAEAAPRAPAAVVSVGAPTRDRGLSALAAAWDLGLAERLAGDVAVAAAVTAAASPFLTVIDKAVVQRAAGSHTILKSAQLSVSSMISNPAMYLRSPTFLWMWATYASTYSAANCLRTVTEQREYDALSGRRNRSGGSQVPQQYEHDYERQKKATTATLFVGTTLVNSTASLIKDQAYAKLFGGAASASSATIPAAVPRVSYGLWIARDLTVIGSSFVLPAYVSQWLHRERGWDEASASRAAQIGTPLAAQLAAGPLHYLGLDCYSRPLSSQMSWSAAASNRARNLVGALPELIPARMLRVLPGYGVAGVLNAEGRNAYRNYLIERKVRGLMALPAATLQRSSSASMPSPLLPPGGEPVAAGGCASGAPLASRVPARKTEELVTLIRAKSIRYDEKL
jgi:hypothetical protein